MTLKELREAKKYTQSEVAKEVGVALYTYQLWERGNMKPSDENKKKLEHLLGKYD